MLENNTKKIEVASVSWFSRLKQKKRGTCTSASAKCWDDLPILDQKTVFVTRITTRLLSGKTASLLSWQPRVISENPCTFVHLLATSAEVTPMNHGRVRESPPKLPWFRFRNYKFIGQIAQQYMEKRTAFQQKWHLPPFPSLHPGLMATLWSCGSGGEKNRRLGRLGRL